MTKPQVFVLIFLIVMGCKKAFTPPNGLSDTNKYLVIDGVINSGNDSTFIRLSRTKKFDGGILIDHETGAHVTVESDANESFLLTEVSAGTYSVALNLNNAHKCRLRIKTSNGKEYLSDFVVVKNSPPIDSVGFAAKPTGVQIYANTHDATNNTKYYRWEYTEAWKFHSTFESFYDQQSPRLYYVYFCYARDTSSYIVLGTSAQLNKDEIYQAPITSIIPTSEKIEIKYSIEVKQFALTTEAYTFWNNLHKNSETNGTIFDAQPSDNQTNYHCLTDPNELVVGYLSAGHVTKKRIFIDRSQLLPSYQPGYTFAGGCSIDTTFVDKGGYGLLGDTTNNTAIQALFYSPFQPFGVPNAITYSTTDCADCTSRGVTVAPYFWR